jgi:hypothetical protein
MRVEEEEISLSSPAPDTVKNKVTTHEGEV